MRHVFKNILLSLLMIFIASSASAKKLRFSHDEAPGSEQDKWVTSFVEKAVQYEPSLNIRVYPASQLGDYEEVYDQVMEGSVDMIVVTPSTKYDKRIAFALFPYLVNNYEEAEKAFSKGGFAYDIVDELLEKQNLMTLGIFADGFGGLGFTKKPENVEDPNAKHSSFKIRVWPSGVAVHKPILDRFGYNTTTINWSELYTALQTGIVDGMIGAVPNNILHNFRGPVKVWFQWNEYFDLNWLLINKDTYGKLTEPQKAALLKAGAEVTEQRFKDSKANNEQYLEEMAQEGIEVIIPSDEVIAQFADIVRKEVWPDLKEKIGEDIYQKMLEETSKK